jgi:hypothetical protein
MSTFENVTVVKTANVYFDGKVTSRTINFDNGEMKTLGIMLPGEYNFTTAAAEVMDIQSGDVEVRLADTDEWFGVSGGESFTVPANSSFDIRAKTVTDYCCSFVAG